MEDIICPECGRPNLAEAKKCWYCQTELIRLPEEKKENLPESQTSQIPEPDIANDGELAHEIEEDIPEWLLKIRKRIENDRGPEEELPYWKQKDIFGGEKKIVNKPSKEKRKQPAKKTTQQQLDIDESKDKINISHNETSSDAENKLNDKSQIDNLDNLSNELPDGFTKL